MGIKGIKKISLNVSNDDRGESVKVLSEDIIRKDFATEFVQNEIFLSVSKRNVIRGMHFQSHPYEQKKYIYVIKGKILGVVLDLRRESETYLQKDSFVIKKNDGILVPKGCAWGFKSYDDENIVLYSIDGKYNKESDLGIKWNSFGFDWATENPILSDRDRALPNLCDYIKKGDSDV